MKLWVFGDSFSISNDYKNKDLWNYDTNWIVEVQKKLQLSQSLVISQFGVSNEWIFKHFIQETGNFQSGDFVICQLTSPNRHWFFEDRPALSNIVQLRTNDFSKDETLAIDYYLRHLQNNNLDDIIYTSLVYSLLYIKNARPDIKVIVIPGFSDFPGVKGNLTNHVSDKEIINSEVRAKFYHKTGYDPRPNHMTIDNHHILANKIVDYFKKNVPLDLTTGFKADIYTQENV
jgi:hypothetical protein